MNEIMYASIDGFRMGFAYLMVALRLHHPLLLGITGEVKDIFVLFRSLRSQALRSQAEESRND